MGAGEKMAIVFLASAMWINAFKVSWCQEIIAIQVATLPGQFRRKGEFQTSVDRNSKHKDSTDQMFIHSFISTYLYRMTISVIVVTAINMGRVFITQRTATTPGTSRPTLFLLTWAKLKHCKRSSKRSWKCLSSPQKIPRNMWDRRCERYRETLERFRIYCWQNTSA